MHHKNRSQKARLLYRLTPVYKHNLLLLRPLHKLVIHIFEVAVSYLLFEGEVGDAVVLEVVGNEVMGHIDDACNMIFEDELLILSYTGLYPCTDLVAYEQFVVEFYCIAFLHFQIIVVMLSLYFY